MIQYNFLRNSVKSVSGLFICRKRLWICKTRIQTSYTVLSAIEYEYIMS